MYNKVSWIRRRDWHIMSVGETVYTSDDRVAVTRKKDSTDWQLQFKFAKERDEGSYECQVVVVVVVEMLELTISCR